MRTYSEYQGKMVDDSDYTDHLQGPVHDIGTVWTGYAKALGHNGETGDDHESLMVAPAVEEDAELLYITGNGDPTRVASRCELDGTMFIEFFDEFLVTFAENEDAKWILDAIRDEYTSDRIDGPLAD